MTLGSGKTTPRKLICHLIFATKLPHGLRSASEVNQIYIIYSSDLPTVLQQSSHHLQASTGSFG